jgi:broad specificity phosphatase PhoE
VEVDGFERDEPFAERVASAIDAIITGHLNEDVAVITHGGVVGSFLRQCLAIPLSRRGPFAVDNTSITTFEIVEATGARRVQIIGLNDTCHLDGL